MFYCAQRDTGLKNGEFDNRITRKDEKIVNVQTGTCEKLLWC
ncbi:hypothetical protein A464_272 [Salmonella bongori N268-08]|uniref:Uncharacterized protein n=1 Tax=Salmonella bongori N268-08 TaxID=1197719 RepID=S5MS90_SALBN|nr:hypothetical protein A464_272 [Salmonella bongori N268-08]